MKVFLSWSGDVSYKVAFALHEWLPRILQRVQPFLSSGDISKGERWSDVLAKELQDSSYGIICVTPYNVNKPWINFEAGALSKFVGRSCITPLLFDIERSAGIKGPLAQFQSALCTEEDMFNLAYSINHRMPPDEQVAQEILKETFSLWWCKLEKKFNEIKKGHSDETTTEFKWLYDHKDLQTHWISTDDKDVWIITSHIFDLVMKDDIRRQIRDNIEKNGITYKYFVPQSYKTDLPGKEALDQLVRDYNGKVEVKVFDDEHFYGQAPADFIIINPISDSSASLRVYLKLPVEALVEGTEYWIKAAEHASKNFRHRFEKMWNEERTSESPQIAEPAQDNGVQRAKLKDERGMPEP
jgi:TIR domain